MAAKGTDDEYEEEECLVYMDFESKSLDDQLKDPNLKMNIIGIDTDSPILQVNSKVFKGTYDYAMGTNVFFTAGTQPPESDPNFREIPDRIFEYFDKTTKVLKMKRIFVEERDKIQEEYLDIDAPEALDNLRVTKTYGDALNQFLVLGEEPPRLIEDNEVPVGGEPLPKSKPNKDLTAEPSTSRGHGTRDKSIADARVESADGNDIDVKPSLSDLVNYTSS